MVKSEVSKILAVLAAAYSRFEVNEVKLQLWYEMLMDIQYMAAQAAVKKLICESSYPPSIADIRSSLVEIFEKDDANDAGAAWGEVMKGIRNFGLYRPDEALSVMSERTDRVVKQLSWSEICLCENLSVIRGQFIKMYGMLEEREKKDRLLPPDAKKQIGEIMEQRLLEAASAKNPLQGLKAANDKYYIIN